MDSNTIIKILHSIQEIRLKDGELEIKFTESNGWELNDGYVLGSFTDQLLLLIEEALKGELPTNGSCED